MACVCVCDFGKVTRIGVSRSPIRIDPADEMFGEQWRRWVFGEVCRRVNRKRSFGDEEKNAKQPNVPAPDWPEMKLSGRKRFP